MPYMYFSGEDSNAITFDDPYNDCIVINPELYDIVRNNKEQKTRVFLDIHLLKIRGGENKQEFRTEKLVSKGNASVDVGKMPSIPILVYTSRALITAEFREMSSDEFKETYLAPPDNALRESNIRRLPLAREYTYPVGNAMHVELSIQEYFNERISPGLKDLFHDLGDINNHFGSPSFVIPPLDQERRI